MLVESFICATKVRDLLRRRSIWWVKVLRMTLVVATLKPEALWQECTATNVLNIELLIFVFFLIF